MIRGDFVLNVRQILGPRRVETLSLGDQVNGDLNRMHHSGMLDYDYTLSKTSPRPPVKAVHDWSMMFPDTDSGFGSFKSKSRHLEDFSSTVSHLPRSQSLSRLNGLSTQEMTEVLEEKPVRYVHAQLEDSEARRNVLVHKLKEAQATLELQNDRLAKIESSAKDNSVLVEDLKFKEREYRKKITQLQTSEEDKLALQMENVRLREEMQHRIDTLDFQLKGLKNQHQSTEDENERRVNLLDQTTATLSLLEEENTKLQMDRDKLREEISVMKEAFQLSRTRYSSAEEEGKVHRAETERLREENMGLNKRVHEMAGQMIELRNLLQAVKDENERLSTFWKTASEDKNRASKQAEGYQDSLTDIKSRLAAALADKDRLFQERLDLNNKVQKMILEKEQLLKAKMVLEEQIVDQQKMLDRTQSSTSRQDNQKKYLEDELSAVKRVSEDLSSELASVKAFYERALEQLSVSENGKKVLEQQLQLAEQERRRLQAELDRLAQILDGRHRGDREERHHLEETILKMRKLKKANDEIRGGIGKQYDDLETWKTACDRLTASVTRKETELQNLSDKCHSLENQLTRAQSDLRQSREKEDITSDMREENERLRVENRRLLQEKAENEQMLQLLETQRDVLTKSTESSLNKLQDVEQLSGKVDQMRNENELLRQRISELEKVRDNLIKQKEELLASSELIYKSQGLEELEGKMEELRDANKQLRDINEVMSNKLQIVEQENLRLKQSMGDGSTREEVRRLQEENNRLLGETKKLQREKQELTSQTSKDTETSSKEVQKIRKERDALQKQVQLVNGQLNLLEGSKKRSDETAQRTQDELKQVRSQLEATRKECSEAKRVAAQVKSLSEQLNKAKEQQESQEKLIRTMKEELEEERAKKPAQIQESLEDVGAELQQMSGQLHKLMREIEIKEQTIERLEGELRTARDSAETKERSVSELKKLVSDLEAQNTTMKGDGRMDVKRGGPSRDDRPSSASKIGERSLKEELEDAVKSKQEADRAAEAELERLASGGKSSVTAGQPIFSKSASQNTSWSSASDTSSGQLPQFVLTTPSSSSEEDSATDTSGFKSPEDFLRTSTPNKPRAPPKKYSYQSQQKETDSKHSSKTAAHSMSSNKTAPKGLLGNVSLDSTETGLDLSTSLAKDGQKSSVPQKTGSSGGDTEKSDINDFPPISAPPVEQTKTKLSFAIPQPASRTKVRKLPQIKLPASGQASSALAQKTAGSKDSKAAAGAVARSDITKQKSQLPATPKVPTPAPKIRAKASPRESRNQYMSRKELTGRPSKLLSDSGVTVIATKTRSSPNTTTDVKYVVKKQEASEKKDSAGSGESALSTGQDSLLKSFDDLLSARDKAGSSLSSGLSSGSKAGREQPPSSKSKMSTDLSTKQSSDKDETALKAKSESAFSKLLGSSPKDEPSSKVKGESTFSKLVESSPKDESAVKAKSESAFSKLLGSSPKDEPSSKVKGESAFSKLMESSSDQPASKSAAVSESGSAQQTSTDPSTPVSKSSSVRDFLASFSTTGGKSTDKDREKAQTGEQKSKKDVPVKSSFSRSSGNRSTISPILKSSIAERSTSSASLQSFLPKEQKEKEKLAELIVSLASEPSFGSSLSSTDSWTLLLDETAGERTLSYEKLEQLAEKYKASTNKPKESVSKGTAGKTKESQDKTGVVKTSSKESQDKKGMTVPSSTSSHSANVKLAGIMRQSLEEGQPAKFKPATGLFLSKSLGHPISALSSQQAGGDTEPDKSGTEGSGDRLQSLISKYRSHSSDSSSGISSSGGGVKARESSAPPALSGGLTSSQGKSFTPGAPKAPTLRSGSSSASDTTDYAASGKKVPPPPPPPKPGKSLMKSLSGEGGAKAEGAEMLDSQEQSDINALIQKFDVVADLA